MRILLVESPELDLEPIERRLAERGHRIDRTESVREEGPRSSDDRPDLVLIGDGSVEPELAIEAWDRRTDGSPRIVLVTGTADTLDAGRWRGVVDDWMVADSAELESRLDWVLAHVDGEGKVDGGSASRTQPVAEFGLYALRNRDETPLFKRAVATAQSVIDAPLVAVLLHRSDRDRFLLGAGVGWRSGLVGHATVEDASDTAVGYAFRARRPVRVKEYGASETTRVRSTLEENHGVESVLAVPVESADGPSGVLLIADVTVRAFTDRETDLAQQVANVVGETIARHRARQELSKSEARTRAVLDNTVEGIITIDPDGTVRSFNKAAEEIFGYRAEEVLGRNVSMLMPEPYRKEHDDYIQRYLETGNRRIIGIGREVRGLRRDGSVFPMHLSVSEVEVGDEHLFTGLVRDVSQRRRLEREIINISEEERQRLGQELHDGLGQTLSAIALFADTVADELEEAELPQAEEVDRIARLIRDADEEARQLARGLVPVHATRESLSDALDRLALKLNGMYDVEVEFRSTEVEDDHLPDGADANHLYRIAQEAAANAARHGRPDRIEITLVGTADHVRLQVRDDGTGFEPDETEGEGLGLRTMEYRARLAGGELRISSVPGRGTTVTCTVSEEDRVPRGSQVDGSSPGGCPVDHG